MPAGSHLPLSLTSHLPVRWLSIHHALACPTASSSRFARWHWQAFLVLKANRHDSLLWHLNFLRSLHPSVLGNPALKKPGIFQRSRVFTDSSLIRAPWLGYCRIQLRVNKAPELYFHTDAKCWLPYWRALFFPLTTAACGSVWHIVSECVAGLQTHLNGTLLTSTNFWVSNRYMQAGRCVTGVAVKLN